ncbi:MAG: T9SS type A sorting domain-containing protein [Bacteroidota bacterium]|jgi:hypothetical protein
MTRVSILFIIVVFLSQFALAQWEKLSFPSRTPYTLLQTSQGLLAANEKTIFRSTDNGIRWDSLSSIVAIGISEMMQMGNTLIVVSSRSVAGFGSPVASVFRSEDFGRTLDPVLESVYGANSIAFLNGHTYVNPDANLYTSLDSGKTWTKMNPPLLPVGDIQQIVAGVNVLFVAASRTLYRSRDFGLTWDSLHIPFKGSFYNILARDSCVYIGTFSEGFYSSSDQGQSWSNASNGLPDSSGIAALFMNGNNLVASVSKNFQQTVYSYNLLERVWHQFNDSFTLGKLAYVHSFANNSDYLFLGSDSSVWRRPLGQWITGVPKNHPPSQTDFVLYQNFPNPFNPSTTLTFSADKTQYATLKIFDALGREIQTLFAGTVHPGIHIFHWQPMKCSSGVYFARLNSGSYSITREVVFLK